MRNWQSHYLTRLAAKYIARGRVVAYPTEAVWGLGCAPNNRHALEQVLALKRRSPDKGLILVAASIEQLAPYLTGVTPSQRAQLNASWPGPFTWLVPATHAVHPLVRGQFDTVALRVSGHPMIRALCESVGGPIVSTSANPQGCQPATSRWQVMRYFGGHPLLSLATAGQIGASDRPSEIRDLASGNILRR